MLYHVLHADPVLAFSELHGTKSFIHPRVKFVIGRFCDPNLSVVHPPLRPFHSSECVLCVHELHGANYLIQLIDITVSQHKMYSWFKGQLTTMLHWPLFCYLAPVLGKYMTSHKIYIKVFFYSLHGTNF